MTGSDRGRHIDAPTSVVNENSSAAARLKEAREAAGFRSARAAALRFGWPYETYHQHERGQRGLGRKVGCYATAFNVNKAWLLIGEGPSPNSPPSSIDEKLRVLPQEDYDELVVALGAFVDEIVKSRLERRRSDGASMSAPNSMASSAPPPQE